MTKALAVAVVLFFVALGVVVGLRMDDRTVSMLGGVAIGLIIGVPCALLGLQAAQGRNDSPRYAEPPLGQLPPVQPVQHFHYHDNRTVVMPSPPNSQGREAARQMLKDGKEAQR